MKPIVSIDTISIDPSPICTAMSAAQKPLVGWADTRVDLTYFMYALVPQTLTGAAGSALILNV
jgi:hypothetical protein